MHRDGDRDRGRDRGRDVSLGSVGRGGANNGIPGMRCTGMGMGGGRRNTGLRQGSLALHAISIAENKKSGFEYEWEHKIEAGVQLVGTEVKACRRGNVILSDGYAQIIAGELWLCSVHISEYHGSGPLYQHEVKRNRKLLVKRKEILKLEQQLLVQNCELLPISMYFNDKRFVKVLLGVGRKKNLRDKRQDVMQQEGNREIRRVMKNTSYD